MLLSVVKLVRDRIYELIGSGRLRSEKLGRSRRIPAAELPAFVEDLSRGGSPLLNQRFRAFIETVAARGTRWHDGVDTAKAASESELTVAGRPSLRRIRRTGRRLRRNFLGRTRGEVQRKLDEARQRLHAGELVADDRRSVADLLEQWLKYAEQQVRARPLPDLHHDGPLQPRHP